MVFVYIIIFFVAATCIGEFATSRSDAGRGYQTRRFGKFRGKNAFDREENPRHSDDGTSFGYRPGD